MPLQTDLISVAEGDASSGVVPETITAAALHRTLTNVPIYSHPKGVVPAEVDCYRCEKANHYFSHNSQVSFIKISPYARTPWTKKAHTVANPNGTDSR